MNRVFFARNRAIACVCTLFICLLFTFTACKPHIASDFAPTIEQHFSSTEKTLNITGTVDLPNESYVCVTLIARGKFADIAAEYSGTVNENLANAMEQLLSDMDTTSVQYAKVLDGAFSTDFQIENMKADFYDIIVTLPFGVEQAPQPSILTRALGKNGEALTSGKDGITVPAEQMNNYYRVEVIPVFVEEYLYQLKQLEILLDEEIAKLNSQYEDMDIQGVSVAVDKEQHRLILVMDDDHLQGISESKELQTFLGDNLLVPLARQMSNIFEVLYNAPVTVIVQDAKGMAVGEATVDTFAWDAKALDDFL